MLNSLWWNGETAYYLLVACKHDASLSHRYSDTVQRLTKDPVYAFIIRVKFEELTDYLQLQKEDSGIHQHSAWRNTAYDLQSRALAADVILFWGNAKQICVKCLKRPRHRNSILYFDNLTTTGRMHWSQQLALGQDHNVQACAGFHVNVAGNMLIRSPKLLPSYKASRNLILGMKNSQWLMFTRWNKLAHWFSW